jgi:hypothetical protein
LTLTTFGSGYYHLHPTDQRLFWDRLPMTIAFAPVFAPALAMPLLAVLAWGVASVFYWRYTGNLVWYIMYQYGGIMASVFVPDLRLAVLMYIVAKVCESNDKRIYALTNRTVSGHTLKHLIAASASLCV